MLSQKLLLLLLILGGQRMNTIHHFAVDNLNLTDMSATFSSAHVLKHSKAGRKQDVFIYRSHPHKELCVIDCLKEYF